MEKEIDMADEKRCEPLGHLRGSDGEHFVCGPNGLPFVALWHAAPHAGIEPLWHNAARTSTGTPAWAANEWGWRYLAQAHPPAVVAALVELVRSVYAEGWQDGRTDDPSDTATDAWDRSAAHVALAAYKGEGR